MAPGNAHIKAAPHVAAIGQGLGYQRIGLRRQAGVGVQKEQGVALGVLGAGVHLQRAAAWGLNDLHRSEVLGKGLGNGHGVVGAAAIGQHQLRATRQQGREGLQGRGQTGCLVERGHDDAQPWRAVSQAAHV